MEPLRTQPLQARCCAMHAMPAARPDCQASKQAGDASRAARPRHRRCSVAGYRGQALVARCACQRPFFAAPGPRASQAPCLALLRACPLPQPPPAQRMTSPLPSTRPLSLRHSAPPPAAWQVDLARRQEHSAQRRRQHGRLLAQEQTLWEWRGEGVRVMCGSWNTNGRLMPRASIAQWLRTGHAHW